MRIVDACKNLEEFRSKIHEHEDAIRDLLKDSLKVVNSVSFYLVGMADQSYSFNNGRHFLDEAESNVDLSGRIEALENCQDALSETLRMMREMRDELNTEGEF